MPRLVSSGYSEGIFSVPFDDSTGNTGGASVRTDSDRNLSFSVYDPEKRNLYCVHEVAHSDHVNHPKVAVSRGETGAVSRWRLRDDGTFERKEVLSSFGKEPAHVAIHTKRRLLFVTNYGGGSISVFRLSEEDGEILSPPVYQETIRDGGSKVDLERQEASHLHGTFLHGDTAYVVDLGGDKVLHYAIDAEGTIRMAGETRVDPGSGPRHMAVDEKRSRAYLLNELKNSIVTFEVDGASGTLKEIHRLEYVLHAVTPGTRQYGAAIAIHPNGRFVYASNRGDGAILVLAIDEESKGGLRQVESVSTGGTWPRHFALTADGRHLAVVDQFRHDVCIFRVDPGTGKIAKGSEIKCLDSPSMILFL